MSANQWWREATVPDVPLGSRWRRRDNKRDGTIEGVREATSGSGQVVVDVRYASGNRRPFEITRFRLLFEPSTSTEP